MAFWEKEFPRKLSFGSSGGRTFFTTKNEGFGGFRNYVRNCQYPLGKWSITVRSQESANTALITDYDLFYNFFINVFGQADGFRFYAPGDHTATLETIGMGDGSNTTFQLTKNFVIGDRSFPIPVTKPIMSTILDYKGDALTDTVHVYLNGTPTSAWTLDSTTGVLTMTSPPANGVVVKWSGEYHIPVHFASDEWKAQIEESYAKGKQTIFNVASMPIEEMRV
jgi:uncharacterized protein (TIGR02217 family)